MMTCDQPPAIHAPAPIKCHPVLGPMAFSTFCIKWPANCEPQAAATEWTERRKDLDVVNSVVNGAIRPESEPPGEDVWLLAPEAGDCDDYAVTKQHILLAKGWPSAALRLAIVKMADDSGHLVLVVATKTGDVILDNMIENIVPARRATYRLYKMQSTDHPQYWKGPS